MSSPLLPQHDPASDSRVRELWKARDTYQITFEKYPGIPMLASLPACESPPPGWSAVVDAALKSAMENAGRADTAGGEGLLAGLTERAREVAAVAGELFDHHGLTEMINDVTSIVLAGDLAGRAASVDDYRRFFRTVPVPRAAERLFDDAAFAQRALRGANPLTLARATHPPKSLTDTLLQVVSPGDRVEAALDEARLYELDYRMLTPLVPNTVGGTSRYTLAPRVFLVADPSTRALMPVAIELTRGGDLFTPADSWSWRLAKSHAAVADTIAGALWHHHARTHIVAEPMVIAMHRHLSVRHPLHLLLAPHFQGTLYINDIGHRTVFAEHGALDWITGAGRDSLREMVCTSVRTFDFATSVFERELTSRGVHDAELLPHYPLRDDGRLVWAALNTWVGDYVALYYPNDATVFGDNELRSWAAEIAARDGGGINGFPQAFTNRASLVEALTQIIFSGSALHAAMNFPVADEMTFVPNSPFAAYGTPPTSPTGGTEAQWLSTLPPLGAAQRQFVVAQLLGLSRYGSLGAYEQPFTDERVGPRLSAFALSLGGVEATIQDRNTTREPYVHLMPSRIPPGINI